MYRGVRYVVMGGISTASVAMHKAVVFFFLLLWNTRRSAGKGGFDRSLVGVGLSGLPEYEDVIRAARPFAWLGVEKARQTLEKVALSMQSSGTERSADVYM
jgi:hypothetical protein